MRLCSEEVLPLRATDEQKTAKMFGMEVELDDADWHWCVVMPMVTDKNRAYFEEVMEDPVRTARKFFKERTWAGHFYARNRFKKGMTRMQFHAAFREILVEVLVSSRNGFKLGKEYSIDLDEIFLLVQLENLHAQRKLAEKLEVKTALDPAAYRELFDHQREESAKHDCALAQELKEMRRRSQLEGLEQPQQFASERSDESKAPVRNLLIQPGKETLPDTRPALTRSSSAYSIHHDIEERLCPTTKLVGGQFAPPNDHVKQCPLYLRYLERAAGKFEPFREVELIRIVRARINEYLYVQELEQEGLIIEMFPVHKKGMVDGLWQSGWSDISRCLTLPKNRHSSEIRDYFGEEVAFFFHYMSFYTRWLLGPSILGIVMQLRPWMGVQSGSDLDEYLDIAFAALLGIWSAVLMARYTQSANLKVLLWGMDGYDNLAATRKEFRTELRNSWREVLQNLLHWKLAVLFMCETLLATWWINQLRMRGHRHPDEILYGVTGSTLCSAGKYLVTINIRIVDVVWTLLSPYLSAKENWKTDLSLKNAIVSKLFAVKFVVYYYPFFYIAFLKEQVEGCTHEQGCLGELRENLTVFFCTDILSSLLFSVYPIVWTRRTIRKEIEASQHKVSAKRKELRLPHERYTYLQVQAKCPQYDSDTDDFMELILSFGFVVMFSAALPIMPLISCVCNMLKIRVFAFRLSYLSRRPEPRGEEGIGSWLPILHILCALGVVSNIALAIYDMKPICDYAFAHKMVLFVVGEHVMFFLFSAFRLSFHSKKLAQVMIEEVNDDVAGEILCEHELYVEVDQTPPLDAHPDRWDRRGLV